MSTDLRSEIDALKAESDATFFVVKSQPDSQSDTLESLSRGQRAISAPDSTGALLSCAGEHPAKGHEIQNSHISRAAKPSLQRLSSNCSETQSRLHSGQEVAVRPAWGKIWSPIPSQVKSDT